MCSRNRSLSLLKHYFRGARNPVSGFTLIEALVTIIFVGVLGAVVAPNISALGVVRLPDNANRIAGQFRAVRARAIAQTTQFRIRPDGAMPPAPPGQWSGGSNTQLIVERSISTFTDCGDVNSANWTIDSSFTRLQNTESGDLTFGKGTGDIILSQTQIDTSVLSVPTGWMLCFSPRGLSTVINRSNTNASTGAGLILTLRQTSSAETQRLEIFPGGMVQVHEKQSNGY